MPRPVKCRCIWAEPGICCFKPQGVPVSDLEEVVLTVDEFEALRLADKDGLYQESAARRMKISRQTFGNIVGCARRKVAEAIVCGKALRIHGGRVRLRSGQPKGLPAQVPASHPINRRVK